MTNPSVLELSDLDSSNGFRISGGADGDGIGFSVSGAGDVNGDDIPDLIIGAPHDAFTGNRSGAVYVVFGKEGGFSRTIMLSDLSGPDGFKVNGEAASDLSGLSVASAGDVNGDGFSGVIIGAPYASSNGSRSGASYVVFGKADGFDATIEVIPRLPKVDSRWGFANRLNSESVWRTKGNCSPPIGLALAVGCLRG